MKKLFIIILPLMLTCLTLSAQNKLSINGTVTDKATGETLIGVSVKVEGTTLGTITDFNGKYQLTEIPKNSSVAFSFVGMKSVTLKITSGGIFNVSLESEAKGLDEIVVVGYGTARKRDLTGSIVSISGEDLKTSPDYNPVKALQGKVPGLVLTNNGSAGGSPTIRIRGVATINASTNPLFIVDGLFTDNIDFINPTDISSMEVLKDPSSLAIFGVQGANGVIIVTTKRASKGKLTVNYDGYGGLQVLSDRDRLKLTNASDFTMLYNEQLKNIDPTAADWVGDLLGGGTDWQSYIFSPALITNHGITISQSTDNASTVLSLGYFKQDGIVNYNSYQRFNGRWAGDYKVSKNIKVGGNVTLNRWDNDPATASVSNAAKALPTYSPYSPEEDHDVNNIGSYYTPSPNIQKDVANPVAVMEINKGTSESYGYRAVGNIYAEINFLKDFSFKATAYGDLGISMGSDFTPYYDVNNETSISSHKSEKTSFSRSTSEYSKYQVDYILNYNKVIDKHRIGALAGYTARVSESKGFSASTDSLISGSTTIVPEDFWMLSMGSDLKKYNSDWYSSESFASYLGRINYSYDNKYIAVLTFRADGSSKFSPTNRWGYFPSVGLGWIASEENFWKDMTNDIDYLKVKASWGKLGNDKIGNYLWLPSINPKGQQVVAGGVTYYLPTQDYVVDENIHWEVVSGLDAGFESQLFKNRMNVELTYYSKTTNDLLAYVDPPASVGSGYAITNAGSVQNSGVEFIVGWKDKIGGFDYGVSVNGATLKNEVLALGNDNSDLVSTYHRTSVGHSIGAIYGYVQEGIFQTQDEIDNYYPASWTSKPGDIKYKDLNGDEEITDKDRDFIGTTIPTFTYGMSVNVGYSNFDLSIDFNGSAGNSIINTKKLPQYAQFNYYSTALNRWHGEGTSNFEPILDNSRGNNFLPSTNLLESASYFRVRSIQLGYNLPKNTLATLGIGKARVYVSAQNPITFKSNSGYTPEIGGSILAGGIDSGGTYPIPSVYTAGISVNF